MDWFRWWHGTLTDPKFQWVARKSGQPFTAVIALWVALLERASSVTQGDASVTRGDVTGFDCDDHDVLFGLDDGSCALIFDAFKVKGMIVESRIAKWEERQPKREDSSAERTRAYRERKAKESSLTAGDGDVTHGDAEERDATPREEKIREEKEKPLSGKPDHAREIIEYLNEKAGRRFQIVKASISLVNARLAEGATVDQCKAVIDVKVKAWAKDPKMSEYLRPETLFGAKKFASYVGQLGPRASGGSDWWATAGFANEWDAMNAGCTEHNARFFRDGVRTKGEQ